MNRRIHLRPAQAEDLDAVNRIIRACVMNWKLPERVKRLSVGSYLYNAHDLAHLEMRLAESDSGEVLGVAAWEAAEAADLPPEANGLLLHGLFVDPAAQASGIGSALVDSALDAVKRDGKDGLLVKAQTDAVGFFRARGFVQLAVRNTARDYANRWWKPVH